MGLQELSEYLYNDYVKTGAIFCSKVWWSAFMRFQFLFTCTAEGFARRALVGICVFLFDFALFYSARRQLAPNYVHFGEGRKDVPRRRWRTTGSVG